MARNTNDHNAVFSVTIIAPGGGDPVILDNADVVQLYFIEDIYSWCKVGKMTIQDTQGIWEFLPLVGDEKIELSYYTWVTPKLQEERTYTFSMYKVSDTRDISNKGVGTRERKTKYSIEVYFVEEEYYKLHMPHYSRMYRDFPYIDIVMDMCDRYVGISDWVQMEPSGFMREEFHTGLRTVAEDLRWLTNRMLGDIGGQPGYLLYSNTFETKKSWNLMCLETLLRDAPLVEDFEKGVFYLGQGGNWHNANTILNTQVSSIDKTTIDRLVKCNYLGYDHMRKYMIKKEFFYQDAVDRYTMLGEFTLFNGADLDSFVLKPQEVLTGESGDAYHLAECLMENMYFGDWIKQYCLQQMVQITVRGDMRRYAGGQCEINWLSGNIDARFNKQMIGRYLIKSITHQFSGLTQPAYFQKMNLIKNAYYETDAAVTPASKVNYNLSPLESVNINPASPSTAPRAPRKKVGE